MTLFRTIGVTMLAVAISTSAVAGDLRKSINRAVEQQEQPQNPRGQPNPIPKPYLWAGTAMFVGGMAVGLYAFMHDKNGQFPGTDEYYATNRGLGAAGLLTAFGGGAALFIGKHQANKSTTFTVNRGGVTVSKRLSW
jgi:hypothetical protein